MTWHICYHPDPSWADLLKLMRTLSAIDAEAMREEIEVHRRYAAELQRNITAMDRTHADIKQLRRDWRAQRRNVRALYRAGRRR